MATEEIDAKVIEIVSEQMGVDKAEITRRRTSSTTSMLTASTPSSSS